MSIYTKYLKQTCVYWAPGDLNAYGKPSFSSPVELKCRWKELTKEIITPNGTEVRPEIYVMLGVDVLKGGVLMLGELESGTDTNNPLSNPYAYEIFQFKKVPNMKATKFFRQAILYRKTT